ncbi:MAG: NfeD family protein [Nitriliruptorales bacterium]|nr:NfeD family protein [Nitriliruptorales bacterium]
MGPAPTRLLTAWALAFVTALALATAGTALAQGPTVATTTVDGPITPVVADHLRDVVAQAEREGHVAVVVELDTPGGLVTSMRDIVQSFLNADVPIVVYVSPRGADAGSAGTFITLAAHVAAMAPATTIGAATPVDLEGGEVGDKIVENAAAYAEAIADERGRDVEFAVDSVREGRSVTADEALEVGAVDLISNDLDTLLDEIDGTVVTVTSGEVTLETADAGTVPLEMSGTRRLLQLIADPNLAFVFLSLGTLGIIYEVANPGLGAGGIIGAVLLILSFFSLSVLPVNIAGVALLILAGGLFLAELFAPGVGIGAAGGTVALILGGIFLFQEPTGIGIDLWVLWPTALVLFGMVILAGWLVRRSRGTSSHVASDALIGREAVVRRPDADRPPRVVLDGTYWRVVRNDSDTEPLRDGDDVTIVGRDNLDLIVTHTTRNSNDSEEQS